MDTIDNRDFVEMANPHSWFLVADNLNSQAVALRKQAGNSILMYTNYTTEFAAHWDATNRSVFLLSGFALENAIKAFLVYEHPEWISNGCLSKELKSHSLTNLVKKSSTIPYKSKGMSILRGFEDGLESWARYPCSIKKEATKQEQVLGEKLWQGYEWLMLAYGRRLVKLLSDNWKGPHGFEGKYDIQGTFLNTKF